MDNRLTKQLTKNLITPSIDGYHMPGEFEAHEGCVMIWPVRPGSWPNGGAEAKEAFCRIAYAISQSEKIWMLCDHDHLNEVRTAFEKAGILNAQILEIETDDAWARDVGPTCVVKKGQNVRGIDWCFNAWGGETDGLYAHWDRDNAAAAKICDSLGIDCYDARDFVLEGGSIHSDGEGTVIVTEACLLSEGRNPKMSKVDIENELKEYLGAEKIIWLPNGIYNDETNEHVDNVCAFVKPGEVVLAWTEDVNDPQFLLSCKDLAILERETDAKGRKFIVHKLPIPKKPVCITEEELEGFVFEEGEDVREVGERLAASYVNFYISNGGVILPQFGDENDAIAVEMLQKLFPERVVYPIYARPIIVGGGNIHCITQQIPKLCS
ncbi:MAG: agmatine deiminase [Agathobacter sp.]